MQTQVMTTGDTRMYERSMAIDTNEDWIAREEMGQARRARGAHRRAVGLGWFSIGLGLAQVIAPTTVAELIGARPTRRTSATMRAIGVRELACGVAILRSSRRSGWMWTRVAGDLMDVAFLGRTLQSRKSVKERTSTGLASVAGVLALDIKTAMDLRRIERGSLGTHRGIHVVRAVTVNRPRDEVYRFWRDFENLPRFMAHLESVQVLNGRSRWRAKGPVGKTIEWEATLTEDRPGERIAWQSQEDDVVPNRGSVMFREAPGGRGTEVVVELKYDPPAGPLGAALLKLFGKDPKRQVADALRRFKQMIEVGEEILSDASIHRRPHPAQPPKRLPERGRQVMR